jgi:hypothetical protein
MRGFRVGFPEGAFGDRLVELLRVRLDGDSLEALYVAKLRLERSGPENEALMAVLDRQVELAFERLGAGGWFLMLACKRAQGRIDILGVDRSPGNRPALERAAREALSLPHAAIEWMGESGIRS